MTGNGQPLLVEAQTAFATLPLLLAEGRQVEARELSLALDAYLADVIGNRDDGGRLRKAVEMAEAALGTAH